jgi:hypothetical protein
MWLTVATEVSPLVSSDVTTGTRTAFAENCNYFWQIILSPEL